MKHPYVWTAGKVELGMAAAISGMEKREVPDMDFESASVINEI